MRQVLFIFVMVVAVRVLFLLLSVAHHPVEEGLWARMVQDGSRGDAGWYARIAEHGYPRLSGPHELGHAEREDVHQSEWAFFPLYPLLVRATATALGCRTEVAMWWLGLVICIGAALMYRAFAGHSDPGHGAWHSAVLLSFPMAMYLHVYYTEALFLLLLMGVFAFAQRKWWTWCATSLALLVLVRPNGLFAVPALLLYVQEQEGLRWERALTDKRMMLRLARVLLPAATVWAAYAVFQWHCTGSAFAFSLAQAGWGRGTTWPFMGFFRSGDVATQVESWYTIVLLGALVAVARRLPLSFNVLIWLNVLMPLCSGSVDSMTRFTLGLFPLLLLLGQWGRILKWRWWLIALALLLQAGWWWLWLDAHPITA
ncbi:MAG: hypothetical protein IPJ76_09565 [Flavobacteriales bacterium]|nr:MAG: hypothetical protein IPJ76_09565 [Flavobacteriales bacterium]